MSTFSSDKEAMSWFISNEPKVFLQRYGYAEDLEVNYKVAFGTPDFNNLGNSEYTVKLVCPHCSSVLEVFVN